MPPVFLVHLQRVVPTILRDWPVIALTRRRYNRLQQHDDGGLSQPVKHKALFIKREPFRHATPLVRKPSAVHGAASNS
jgi:hypothetical protein